MSEQSSNKRIAKNAMYLYIRTLVTTLVGIYTSRVVLQTLGVEDYGLYSVVGGVVGMFGFINASMSGTTSRFITFELGRGNKERLRKTFSSALIVHLGIAVILLILAETVGLWFLCNKLVVPDGRMCAAHWVYQLSVLSALLGIIQVPYDACMVAHERFDISAYISMFSTFAKLGILYFVNWLPFDNLVTYAILVLMVTYITRIYARAYCMRHYKEAHFEWQIDKLILKPMLSFSGWQIFGSLGNIANRQGRSMIVNMFYGVVLNAALGISNTLSGAINGLSFNIVNAFVPSFTKAYSTNNVELFHSQVKKAAFFSFFMFTTFSIPLILERDYIFSLWLGVVPYGTSEICAIQLIFSAFMMISVVLNFALHAIGFNKVQNIFDSVCQLVGLFIMYTMFKNGVSIAYVFVVLESFVLPSLLNRLVLYGKYTRMGFAFDFLKNILLFVFCGLLVQFCALYYVRSFIDTPFCRLLFISLVSVCISSLLVICSPYRHMLKRFFDKVILQKKRHYSCSLKR